jgi:hypothetical protein
MILSVEKKITMKSYGTVCMEYEYRSFSVPTIEEEAMIQTPPNKKEHIQPVHGAVSSSDISPIHFSFQLSNYPTIT